MRSTRSGIVSILLLLTLTACAQPAAPSAPASNGATPAETAPRAPRTLVLAIGNEPEILTAVTGVSGSIAMPLRLFNAGVALKDERGNAQPYLAEALPQLNTDTWKVFPDGRMETTYRLKPGLTWHDGTSLAAEEFVFAWRLLGTPAFGTAGRAPISLMEEVLAPDPRTVVVRWKRPFPDAATMMGGGDFDFTPLPRHILEGVFSAEHPEAFALHPFWTREFVGLGPFRLDRWEPGVVIEAAAFDGHALGRPRIDRLRIRFIKDPNTAVSSLLAGEIQVTDETALNFAQGQVLKREWGARNMGDVLYVANNLNYAGVQLRPELANPKGLLDVRVRRAVAHAVDKNALNEALFEGGGMLADSLISPQVDYYPQVERAITTYAYDPRRAEGLMTEAGFTRGADGIFTHPVDGRFDAEVRYSDRGGAEAGVGAPVLQQIWRQAGFDTHLFAYPSVYQRDGQYRSQYPALDYTAGGNDESGVLHSVSTPYIPKAENRWTGQNRGGWSNPDFDRVLEAYDVTLEPAQRIPQVVDMLKIVSDQLPWIPFYFNLRVIAHSSALSGLKIAAPGATRAHNVHEWELK